MGWITSYAIVSFSSPKNFLNNFLVLLIVEPTVMKLIVDYLNERINLVNVEDNYLSRTSAYELEKSAKKMFKPATIILFRYLKEKELQKNLNNVVFIFLFYFIF